MADLISRQMAIEALRKMLYKLEEEREEYYIKEKKVDEWFIYIRPNVQDMNDLDVETIDSLPSATPWHTGTPTEEGFWLVKYKCVVDGKYNGRLTYRAVKIEKDKIDGFAYESGGIGAEEYWKPIEYQKIDDLWRGEE